MLISFHYRQQHWTAIPICVFPIEAGDKQQQQEKNQQNKTKQKTLKTGCNNNPVFNKGYNSGHFF